MFKFIAIALVTAWMFPSYATELAVPKRSTPAVATMPQGVPNVSPYAACMANQRAACQKTRQFRVTIDACTRWNRYRCKGLAK